MNFWWSEIDKNSSRDQISFNFVSWKMGVKYDLIDKNKRDDYIQIIEHKCDINYGSSSTIFLNLKYLIFKLGSFVKKINQIKLKL